MAVSVPADYPKIIYNSVTLWLPCKFVKYDLNYTGEPEITPGNTYTQIVTYSPLMEIEFETPPFYNKSDDWDGGGAETFLSAWSTFYSTWAGLGKVFSFYRKANGGTSDVRQYLQYCVWMSENDGIQLLTGVERYRLEGKLRQEGASR